MGHALPEQLSRWFGEEVEQLDLRHGGLITFRRSDGTTRRARVDDVEPPERLGFTWIDAEDREPLSTVDLDLEEVSEGTRLTIVESLLPEPDLLPGEILGDPGPILAGDPPPDPPGAPPRILLHA